MELTTNMSRAIKFSESLAQNGHKLLGTHVEGVVHFQHAAEDYLAQYKGSFDFLVKMKANVARYGSLRFPNHIAGILNCMYREWADEQNALVKQAEQEMKAEAKRREAEQLQSEVIDFSQIEEPKAVTLPRAGTYTIQFEDGSHCTLRFDVVKFGRFPEGTMVAEFLSGPDNETNFTGFAFVMANGDKRVWRNFSKHTRQIEALDILLSVEDKGDMGLAYAMLSGRCCACGRKLTVPASLHRGMGPVCAGVK